MQGTKDSFRGSTLIDFPIEKSAFTVRFLCAGCHAGKTLLINFSIIIPIFKQEFNCYFKGWIFCGLFWTSMPNLQKKRFMQNQGWEMEMDLA